MFENFLSYLSLGVSFAKLLKFVSHIARYAPSIQSHIHLKTFAQILTLVFKQPLKVYQIFKDEIIAI